MSEAVFSAVAELDLNTTRFNAKLSGAQNSMVGFSSRGSAALGPLGKRSGPIGAIAGQFSRLGPAVATPAGAAVAAVGGIGAALGGAVSSANRFNQDMARAFALVPDASEEMRSQMSEDVQSIMTEFGIAEEQAVQGLYDALSQGVPPENVLDFLTEGARLAVGQAVPLTTAISAQTTAMQSWGLTTREAAAAGDLFATGVRVGGTEMAGFEAAMAKAGPIASTLGVDIGTLTALIADNTLITKDGNVAGTQMNAMLSELGKEGTKAWKSFEEANGTTFPEFIENGGNITDGLLAMSDSAAENDQTLIDMFSSIEAGKGAMIATREGAENLIETQGAMSESAGAAGEAYDTMSSTVSHNMDRIKAHMSTTMTDIGNAITPAVAAITGFIANAIPAALGFISNAIGGIVDIVKGFWGSIVGDANSFWEFILNYFKTAGTLMKDLIVNLGGLWVWAIRKGFGLMLTWVGKGVDNIIDVVIAGLKVIPGLIIDMAQGIVSAGSRMFSWIPGVGSGLKDLENGLESFERSFDNLGADVDWFEDLGNVINPDEGPSFDFSDTLERLNIDGNPFVDDSIDTSGFNNQGASEMERALAGRGSNAPETSTFANNNQGKSELERALENIPTVTAPPPVTTTTTGGGGSAGGIMKASPEFLEAMEAVGFAVTDGFGPLNDVVGTELPDIRAAIWGLQDRRIADATEGIEMGVMGVEKAVMQLNAAVADSNAMLARDRAEAAAVAARSVGGVSRGADGAGGVSSSVTVVVDDRNTAGRVAEEVAWLETKATIGVSA